MPVTQHHVLTGTSRKIKQKKISKVLGSITIIPMICDSWEMSGCQCDFRPNFNSSCLRLPQLWNKRCIYSAWQRPENFVQLFPSSASQAARACACPQCDLLSPWDFSWWRISKCHSQRDFGQTRLLSPWKNKKKFNLLFSYSIQSRARD